MRTSHALALHVRAAWRECSAQLERARRSIRLCESRVSSPGRGRHTVICVCVAPCPLLTATASTDEARSGDYPRRWLIAHSDSRAGHCGATQCTVSPRQSGAERKRRGPGGGGGGQAEQREDSTAARVEGGARQGSGARPGKAMRGCDRGRNRGRAAH